MAHISEQEASRRKREWIIVLALLVVVGILSYIETRVVRFGAGLPISNTVIMFILININMLVLLLLILLVFRNIVKLLYDRRRKVMGAKLRTKLVVAFAGLSLIPTILLFFFSIQFITSSVAFWFNVPVEHSLERSLDVGKYVYKHVAENNRFYLERVAYQIVRRNLLKEENKKALTRYIRASQRAFNIHAIEVYSARSERLAVALDPDLEGSPFSAVSADEIQKEFHEVNFTTLTDRLTSGEMIRTLGCIPSDADPDKAIGVVAISTVIPVSLSENMAAISRGADQYQQTKMMKKPIQVSHLITLSIVALLIIFCATWFGFYLAKTLTIPIQELAEGTRRVAEGDLNFAIGKVVTDDEMGTLVNAFNRMTRDLRAGKQQLELSARQLRERNLEIEQRRIYMETVLRNVSTGVISIDAAGFISTINKSAEKMLRFKGEEVLNRSYKKVLSSEHLRLAQDFLEELENSPKNSVEKPVRLTIDQAARTFMAHVTALKDDKNRRMGMVVVFDDLTEIERAQRMAAWREVARRIAHEVKNPLTPIKLSAQRLRRKYGDQITGDNAVFLECTQTIIDQVDQIRNLVNEFSAFARLPTTYPEPCRLTDIAEDAVALYREAQPGVLFEVHPEPDIPQLNLDKQQMKRVMINLIDNAVVAMHGSGTISVTLSFDPILKMVRLEVSDTGTGIPPEDKVRLFEPYFSTKRAGMGLGLSIVSAIIEDHNGFIRVQDNQPRGTKFIVELPA
ncbi:MAG: PAS domain-containing protein [Desulfobacterales bacterium]|nr:PAS domain-containing protein [Desulfobacterales bacterium]